MHATRWLRAVGLGAVWTLAGCRGDVTAQDAGSHSADARDAGATAAQSVDGSGLVAATAATADGATAGTQASTNSPLDAAAARKQAAERSRANSSDLQLHRPGTVPDGPAFDGGPVRDGADLVRRLTSVAGGGVRVTYRLKVAGGGRGELVIELWTGGTRRERWSLKRGGEVVSEGSVLQTPAAIWREGAAVARPVGLDAVAAGFDAMSADRRGKVSATVRGRAPALALGLESSAQTKRIAGRECAWQRVAAQTVCVWEASGLPLAYQGEGIEFVATKVETLDDAARAPTLPRALKLRGEPAVDAQELLGFLERGELGLAVLALGPGYRAPLPDTHGQPAHAAAMDASARTGY